MLCQQHQRVNFLGLGRAGRCRKQHREGRAHHRPDPGFAGCRAQLNRARHAAPVHQPHRLKAARSGDLGMS